ncbi:endonuclease 2, partial [Striga asiatica]
AHLNKVAAKAVEKLMPSDVKGNLGILCQWADRIRRQYHRVRRRYRWASELHYINVQDHNCAYKYTRDCIGRNRVQDRCLSGAINNYTDQLSSYKKAEYNLTEALLFLSHFIADIHQPLHVGYLSDKGGNTINVIWFTRKQNLHHIWDTDIIRKLEGGVNSSNVEDLTRRIQQKIMRKWRRQIRGWEFCPGRLKTCPNVYAEESIKIACQWAYKEVQPGSVLKVHNFYVRIFHADEYYQTRLPVVEMRIAQAAIRLAATLNRIFT